MQVSSFKFIWIISGLHVNNKRINNNIHTKIVLTSCDNTVISYRWKKREQTHKFKPYLSGSVYWIEGLIQYTDPLFPKTCFSGLPFNRITRSLLVCSKWVINRSRFKIIDVLLVLFFQCLRTNYVISSLFIIQHI